MKMRKVLLACAFLCSIVSIAFSRVGKACDDSARPIDDVTEVELSAIYSQEKYKMFPRDTYELRWVFKTPSDIDIEKEGNTLELKCDSGEIKGTGELKMIREGEENNLQYFQGDGSTKLDKNQLYTLDFDGKFDKTPTEGDNCELKIYVTLNDEEKSYCTTDKAVIEKPKLGG